MMVYSFNFTFINFYEINYSLVYFIIEINILLVYIVIEYWVLVLSLY